MKSYFPTPIAGGDNCVISSNTLNGIQGHEITDQGISIRAKFAESAMQALIIANGRNEVSAEYIVKQSIICADELIKQLEL